MCTLMVVNVDCLRHPLETPAWKKISKASCDVDVVHVMTWQCSDFASIFGASLGDVFAVQRSSADVGR